MYILAFSGRHAAPNVSPFGVHLLSLQVLKYLKIRAAPFSLFSPRLSDVTKSRDFFRSSFVSVAFSQSLHDISHVDATISSCFLQFLSSTMELLCDHLLIFRCTFFVTNHGPSLLNLVPALASLGYVFSCLQ